MDEVVRWDCTVKMVAVDGLTASSVMDALLGTMELHGRPTRRFADVGDHPIVSADDGTVLVNFELGQGSPSSGDDPLGPLTRAASIARLIAENLVGMQMPLLEARAVRL